MKQLKAIIFDLDGTILDTLDDITQSANYTLNKLNLSRVDKTDVRKYLGHGARRLWELILKDNPNLLDTALSIYLPYLEAHSMVLTKPYKGINELLQKLKGKYKLSVVSNKHQKAVDDVIKHYFTDIFDVVIGEREGLLKKPSPEPLYLALKLLGLNKDEVIFIGDSEVDIQTAKNADIPVIGITWGFRDFEELVHQEPNYLINEVAKIMKIIGE